MIKKSFFYCSFLIAIFALCIHHANAYNSAELYIESFMVNSDKVNKDEEVVATITVRNSSSEKLNTAFKVGFYVNDEKKDEITVHEMPNYSEVKNITFNYVAEEIGVNKVKIILDIDNVITEERKNNNTRERDVEVSLPPSPFSILGVETKVDYAVGNSFQQNIHFIIRSKKDYDDGVSNSIVNIYYLIDERYQSGEKFKNTKYEKSSSGYMVPVGRLEYGCLTTTVGENGKVANFNTELTNTKYHYIITDKFYESISQNDTSKILKEGNITTMGDYDQSKGNDLEIIANSFVVDYLEGDKYIDTRKKYYAKVGFKYFKDLSLNTDEGKKVRHSIKNITTNKTINAEVLAYGLTRVESEVGIYLTRDEFGNFFRNGSNELKGTLDSLNALSEIDEDNNVINQTMTLDNVIAVSDDVLNIDGTIKSPSMSVGWVGTNGSNNSDNSTTNNNTNNTDQSNKENKSTEAKTQQVVETNTENQVVKIEESAKKLHNNDIEQILAELQVLRDIVQEQQTQIKYLTELKKDISSLSENAENSLNNFITYGVDSNTKKLGAGERAAVIHSYKFAFSKLPETEDELEDAIKIANGRWPSKKSESAEKDAKEQFQKIYKRIADMNNASDNAAVTVMAYGLRQKAENRNLESEKSGIKTFKNIYGYHPDSTEDWNIMQAITYSGATRGIDSDGDLLTDDREAELGTDPNNKDSDGDGHLDGIEVANGFDPLK